MSIDRTAYNALVDDDGSNTVGSLWNKAAIKTVLLDPIDVSLADTVRLAHAAGTDTNITAHALASVQIPPLTYADNLRVVVSLFQFNAAGSALYLTAMGDVIICQLDTIGGGSLAVNMAVLVEIVVRCVNGNPRAFLAKANGAPFNAVGQLTRLISSTATIAHWLNGGWNLGLEVGPASAGAQVFWTWSVRKE